MRVSNKVYSVLKASTPHQDWATELELLLPDSNTPPTLVDNRHPSGTDTDKPRC